jgi:hypothetical protein
LVIYQDLFYRPAGYLAILPGTMFKFSQGVNHPHLGCREEDDVYLKVNL